jgi:uncharacterized protein (TIGR02118 family)
MIHQLIFAAPRPGLSEEDFHRYWVQVHAVRYAAKIPQIRRYRIATRIPSSFDRDASPHWSGVAEIWLENEEEQLASLQSKEFLEGARVDEPRWAAFWRTIVLDTDSHLLRAGPEPTRDQDLVKLILLVKRAEGLPLGEFRARSLGSHAELVQQVPGLRRYLQCHSRDGCYTLGEAVLDAAYQLWFDDMEAMSSALASPEFERVAHDLKSFVEPRYIHRMVAREHWIIGPETR